MTRLFFQNPVYSLGLVQSCDSSPGSGSSDLPLHANGFKLQNDPPKSSSPKPCPLFLRITKNRRKPWKEPSLLAPRPPLAQLARRRIGQGVRAASSRRCSPTSRRKQYSCPPGFNEHPRRAANDSSSLVRLLRLPPAVEDAGRQNNIFQS